MSGTSNSPGTNPKSSKSSLSSTSSLPSGSVVRPSPVTERSLLESVAGFINDVQAYNINAAANVLSNANQEIQVTWARFDTADVNDLKQILDNADYVNENIAQTPPLLLVLGYTQGVQIWLIPNSGEAQEVLSWKQGIVKTLRVAPTPIEMSDQPDNFSHCRPLIAMADATGPGTAFTSASFISLKTGEQVQNIKFNSEIADLVVNRRVVVATFKEKLAVFDSRTLEAKFTITSCYPSPGVAANPIALGDRWLAYADKRVAPVHRSLGGMENDGAQSMTAWGINVGSKLAQGVSRLYSNFFSSSPSSSGPSSLGPKSSGMVNNPQATSTEPQKGVVTILDIVRVQKGDRDEVNVSEKIDGVVAHFIAHNKAIVALEFDHSGSLLLTCDRIGNYFHLFRIVAHPAGASYTAVHHLYSLYRGDTPGSVQVRSKHTCTIFALYSISYVFSLLLRYSCSFRTHY